MPPPYKRVLLKLSGEALMGSREYGIDPAVVSGIAREVKVVREAGVEMAIVVGGGNIFRGMALSAQGMDRATADYMGMLATVLNGMALQDRLEAEGVETRLQTAIEMREVAEPYIRRRAIRHLERRRVVIFAAGTGNPFFTTDSAAALRASEIKAQVLLKASKVDGVYDADPQTQPQAKRFTQIDYLDLLSQDLKVMDAAAVSLCRENQVPIIVFRIATGEMGNIRRVVFGEPVGTLVDHLHSQAARD